MDRVQQLEAKNEKLRWQLLRERQARIEAEVIAENGLRELYEKQQQHQLLEAIADAVNRVVSVADGLQFTLRTVCQYAGWEVGHVYLASDVEEDRFLYSTSIWHGVDNEHFQNFYEVTEAMDFRSGSGLPGRVLPSATPAWVMEIADEPNFFRAAAAKQAGFTAAAAFPVLLGSEVAAVLEFFAYRVQQPDEKLLRLMEKIGIQMGRLVERKRAEELKNS